MRMLPALLLALLLTSRAFAAQPLNSLPYSYYTLAQSIAVDRVSTPDLGLKQSMNGVRLLDYREVQGFDYEALLTVASKKPAVLVLLLYGGTGGYIAQPGLTLPSDHQTTLSVTLPDQTSVLRLLAFDRQPDARALAAYATHPTSATSQHLLSDTWIRTRVTGWLAGTALLPWEDTLEFFPRLTGYRSRWPYAMARIDSSFAVHAKDCRVDYTGLPLLLIGDRGPIGSWPLQIAESLRLSVYIPPGLSYRRALLVLISSPAGSSFDLRVNGFGVLTTPDPNAQPDDTGIELRGFLRSGSNELELRAPLIGQGGRLERVELWID